MVEFAISAAVLILLAAGMLEYGNLLGSTIDISAATRDAARAGVASTNSVPADKAIVASMLNRSGLKASEVTKVVVYRASSADGTPPGPCTTSFPPPPGLKCNVYRSADLQAANLAATPGGSGWPVSSRVPGSDYLGVWVQVRYSALAGLIWTPNSFVDHLAMRIEPISDTNPQDLPTGFSAGGALDDGWRWDEWGAWGGYCGCGDGTVPGPKTNGKGGSA